MTAETTNQLIHNIFVCRLAVCVTVKRIIAVRHCHDADPECLIDGTPILHLIVMLIYQQCEKRQRRNAVQLTSRLY